MTTISVASPRTSERMTAARVLAADVRAVAFGAILLLGLALAAPAARADALDDVREGALAYGEGRFSDAVAAFGRAIESQELETKALAVTLNNRGVAHGALGRFDEAVEDHVEALQLDPNDGTARRNLQIAYDNRGFARFGSGDYDGALDDYDASLALDAANALAHARRGVLLMELGRDSEAIVNLESAIAIDPGNDKASAALDLARARLSETERAASFVAVEPAAAPAASGERPIETARVEGVDAPNANAPNEVQELLRELVSETREEARAETAPAETASAAPTQGEPATPELAPAAAPAATDLAARAPEAPRASAVVENSPALAVVRANPGAELGVILSAVNYREGPGNDFQRLGTLEGGTLVAVVGERLRWKELLFSDGRRVYVFENFVGAVD